MTNEKIEELRQKLLELEPLSEAKDDAMVKVGTAQQSYNAAADSLAVANAGLEAARSDAQTAEAQYKAKWTEIKELADAQDG